MIHVQSGKFLGGDRKLCQIACILMSFTTGYWLLWMSDVFDTWRLQQSNVQLAFVTRACIRKSQYEGKKQKTAL